MKRRRIFHVNMLKHLHTPTHTNYLAEKVDDEKEVPVWNEDTGNKTKLEVGDTVNRSNYRNY